MLKAIIFDVDGVLVHSKEANIDFFQKLLVSAGYMRPEREEILECFHLPLWQSLEKLTGGDDQVEIKRIWDMAKNPDLRDTSLLEFPKQFEHVLETLHKKYKLAIVTSRIKVGVDDIFKAKEIKHLFDVVVTFEDYENPKPHPEPLHVALKRLHINVDEAVYIGDSDGDIVAATAANMKSIHLALSKHPDATTVISEFQELLTAIDSLEK